MPPVLAYIAVTIATTTWASVIAFAITTVVSMVVSMAITAIFAPKKQGSQGPFSRDRMLTVRQPTAPRRVIYGRAKVGGVLLFMHSTNDDTQLHIVQTLAGHEVAEIGNLYLNDEIVPLDVEGNATGRLAGYVRVIKHLGSATQTADTTLIAEAPDKWSTAHRLQGVAYVYVRLTGNADLFPNGIPNMSFIIKGKNNIYDPRTATYGWTDNAALCISDYLVNTKYGVGAVWAKHMDTPAVIAAANICDEPIELGGFLLTTTAPRYTINGSFDSDQIPEDTVGEMLTAMHGKVIFSGGKWTILAGAYQVPTVTLNEDDARGPIKVIPRISRRDLFNAVKGIYASPSNHWQPADFPAVTNATYETQDNGERIWRDIVLPYTTSSPAAQRIAKIELEKSRQQIIVNFPVKLTGLKLRAGDTCKLSLARFGWTEKVFEVLSWRFEVYADAAGEEALGIDLTLRETAAADYDWNSGMETVVDPAPDTNLPNPFTVSPVTGLALESGADHLIKTGDGGIVSRIYASWTAPVGWITEYQVEYKKSTATAYMPVAPVRTGTSAYISPVEDSVAYDVRVRAVNSIGVHGVWTYLLNHTVIGKTEPPAGVSNLTIDGLRLAWSPVADIDVAGYLIRYQYGTNTEWGTANELHKGVLTSSPHIMQSMPPGTVTLMVRAIDTIGNVSQTSAYVVVNLGDSLVANVIESVDFRSLVWSGTVTNATVIGGNLQANQGDLFYHTDNSDYYGVSTDAFYTNNYDAMTWESSGWTPTLASAGSNMTAAWTLTGDAVQVQYRQTGADLFYGADSSPFYDEDSVRFYSSPPGWQSWPGTVVAQAQEYQWRVTTSTGPTSGLLSAFVVSVDVPDKSLNLNGVSIAAGGSRLSGSVGQFSVIQNIQLTLQGGSTAVMLEASDYANALGPLVVAKNSAGTGVAATIDALLQGY